MKRIRIDTEILYTENGDEKQTGYNQFVFVQSENEWKNFIFWILIIFMMLIKQQTMNNCIMECK
jgi:hypothetical protein